MKQIPGDWREELAKLANGRGTLPVWPETGQLIGLSRNATYDACKRGDIQTLRIGRRHLVPVDEIKRLLSASAETKAD